jgi:hypothetical protein
VHFGIGKATKLDEVKIQWPSGQVSILKDVPLGRHHIVEGKANVLTAER